MSLAGMNHERNPAFHFRAKCLAVRLAQINVAQRLGLNIIELMMVDGLPSLFIEHVDAKLLKQGSLTHKGAYPHYTTLMTDVPKRHAGAAGDLGFEV